METIMTTQLVPVDLNCILYRMEILLSSYHLRVHDFKRVRDPARLAWRGADCCTRGPRPGAPVPRGCPEAASCSAGHPVQQAEGHVV